MKLRKLLIALLAAALLCTAVGAAGYSDLPDTHWANKQVAYLQGEIKGYPDATFRPNNTVTRAEFLTMFARVAYPEEYQAQDASAWWQPAYAVCTAHELLADIAGDRAEPMPRHEIASLLGRFCSGWGGMNESTSAAMPLNINWKEQRLESPERQPIFSDTAKYERSSDNIRFCANQGLLTGYPDGSFQPDKGVTRAEAATVIARLKAQLSLREKGCDYVCTVGQYWLMQCQTEKTRSLALYEPYTGKLHETIFSGGKTAADAEGPLATTLLSGSDGIYVWGEAGLYKRSGDALEQITADPVFDLCWSGDTRLYYLSWDAEKETPSYFGGGVYYPCASQVKLLTLSGSGAKTALLASRDAQDPMMNLTNIYVENEKIYAAGSYFMGMADYHAALFEVKDGKLSLLFGAY